MALDTLGGATRRAVLASVAMAAAAGASRALALPLTSGGGGEAPVAQTGYGAVRGEMNDGVCVFRGIPYGAPTGGDARFVAPEPPKPWGGVRESTHFGDQCPQAAETLPPQWSSWAVKSGESEDCLALNVWTPAVGDGGKRAVMVWLHGGGFSTKSGSYGFNDGVRLCQRGDVVVPPSPTAAPSVSWTSLQPCSGSRPISPPSEATPVG